MAQLAPGTRSHAKFGGMGCALSFLQGQLQSKAVATRHEGGAVVRTGHIAASTD